MAAAPPSDLEANTLQAALAREVEARSDNRFTLTCDRRADRKTRCSFSERDPSTLEKDLLPPVPNACGDSKLKRGFRFVRIGDEFNPEQNVAYSIYLEDQMSRSNRGESFAILEAVFDMASANQKPFGGRPISLRSQRSNK